MNFPVDSFRGLYYKSAFKGVSMKLVITGGAGFLGYHVCNQLKDKFSELSVFDIAPIDPAEYPSNLRYQNLDVRNFESLKKGFAGADLVIHAAAALPLWSKQDNFEINVEGTRNVLEAARQNKIPRVVFISSTYVYGISKRHPVDENHPRVGVDAYGESKIRAERVCEEYRRQGMCVPILRAKTFIGAGRLGVFQILFDWIQSGKKIPIIGSGENHYQLLEVEDLVDAIDRLLVLPEEKVNHTFNIGAEKFGTVLEDMDELCRYAKTGARAMPIPAGFVKTLLRIFEVLKLSPLYKWLYETADHDYFLSIEKIKRHLNWTPRYSNAESLIKSYQWYLEHAGQIASSPTGISHRSAWKQGILGIFKNCL